MGLSGWGPIRNSGAAAKRGIAVGRLPVPGGDELGAIQELGAIEERSGKIGAVEHRLEEVRPLHSGTRQVRIAALRAPQIGAALFAAYGAGYAIARLRPGLRNHDHWRDGD